MWKLTGHFSFEYKKGLKMRDGGLGEFKAFQKKKTEFDETINRKLLDRRRKQRGCPGLSQPLTRRQHNDDVTDSPAGHPGAPCSR